MLRESVDVEIVRELDPAAIGPFENADAKDGILLNRDYIDMRDYSIAYAQEILAEEAQLLDDIKAIGDDDDRLGADAYDLWDCTVAVRNAELAAWPFDAGRRCVGRPPR
ncbi:hypothetical protein WKR98_11100 [Pigmentiphaga sp. YJ18]|uniref:hypothetical protein n=1 Tax=Pigmentiphaga sp. YJ18 TaxID=3134907 RepID=UPI003114B86F